MLDIKENVSGARQCQGKLLLQNTTAVVMEWNCTLLKGTDVTRLHMVPPRGTGVFARTASTCEAGWTRRSAQFVHRQIFIAQCQRGTHRCRRTFGGSGVHLIRVKTGMGQSCAFAPHAEHHRSVCDCSAGRQSPHGRRRSGRAALCAALPVLVRDADVAGDAPPAVRHQQAGVAVGAWQRGARGRSSAVAEAVGDH